jgi:hypothetical protein
MLILNLGVPRSGTVLVHNIIRNILDNFSVPYVSVNTNEAKTEEFLADCDFQSQHILLHAHSMGPNMRRVIKEGKNVVAFFNYRDPRDVLVSLMHLHDHSFEDALKMTDASFVYLLEALKIGRFMFIPYRHLIQAQEAFVFMIGQRFGSVIDLATVSRITAMTSVDKHRAEMERVRDASPAEDDIKVLNNRHRKLKESATSLINDRHIQSGKIGRWRLELTPEQQAVATARFERVIKRLGFEPLEEGDGDGSGKEAEPAGSRQAAAAGKI